jgi:hypothetical protein
VTVLAPARRDGFSDGFTDGDAAYEAGEEHEERARGQAAEGGASNAAPAGGAAASGAGDSIHTLSARAALDDIARTLQSLPPAALPSTALPTPVFGPEYGYASGYAGGYGNPQPGPGAEQQQQGPPSQPEQQPSHAQQPQASQQQPQQPPPPQHSPGGHSHVEAGGSSPLRRSHLLSPPPGAPNGNAYGNGYGGGYGGGGGAYPGGESIYSFGSTRMEHSLLAPPAPSAASAQPAPLPSHYAPQPFQQSQVRGQPSVRGPPLDLYAQGMSQVAAASRAQNTGADVVADALRMRLAIRMQQLTSLLRTLDTEIGVLRARPQDADSFAASGRGDGSVPVVFSWTGDSPEVAAVVSRRDALLRELNAARASLDLPPLRAPEPIAIARAGIVYAEEDAVDRAERERQADELEARRREQIKAERARAAAAAGFGHVSPRLSRSLSPRSTSPRSLLVSPSRARRDASTATTAWQTAATQATPTSEAGVQYVAPFVPAPAPAAARAASASMAAAPRKEWEDEDADAFIDRASRQLRGRPMLVQRDGNGEIAAVAAGRTVIHRSRSPAGSSRNHSPAMPSAIPRQVSRSPAGNSHSSSSSAFDVSAQPLNASEARSRSLARAAAAGTYEDAYGLSAALEAVTGAPRSQSPAQSFSAQPSLAQSTRAGFSPSIGTQTQAPGMQPAPQQQYSAARYTGADFDSASMLGAAESAAVRDPRASLPPAAPPGVIVLSAAPRPKPNAAAGTAAGRRPGKSTERGSPQLARRLSMSASVDGGASVASTARRDFDDAAAAAAGMGERQRGTASRGSVLTSSMMQQASARASGRPVATSSPDPSEMAARKSLRMMLLSPESHQRQMHSEARSFVESSGPGGVAGQYMRRLQRRQHDMDDRTEDAMSARQSPPTMSESRGRSPTESSRREGATVVSMSSTSSLAFAELARSARSGKPSRSMGGDMNQQPLVFNPGVPVLVLSEAPAPASSSFYAPAAISGAPTLKLSVQPPKPKIVFDKAATEFEAPQARRKHSGSPRRSKDKPKQRAQPEPADQMARRQDRGELRSPPPARPPFSDRAAMIEEETAIHTRGHAGLWKGSADRGLSPRSTRDDRSMFAPESPAETARAIGDVRMKMSQSQQQASMLSTQASASAPKRGYVANNVSASDRLLLYISEVAPIFASRQARISEEIVSASRNAIGLAPATSMAPASRSHSARSGMEQQPDGRSFTNNKSALYSSTLLGQSQLENRSPSRTARSPSRAKSGPKGSPRGASPFPAMSMGLSWPVPPPMEPPSIDQLAAMHRRS